MSVPTATTPAADVAETARNNLVIRLLIVAAFTVILNETIMGVAIPHLMEDLGITAVAAQWLTTAFLLTMAVVIPITGFLLQRLTTRAVFMTAMALFATGTLLGALAPGFSVLVLARVIQASGTAIMLPLLMTTVMNLVPAAERGRRMGNITVVIAVAPAIGPAISGAILSVLGWRYLFLFVLPVALTVLALGYARMVNVGEVVRSRLDIPSIPLAAVGLVGSSSG
ncbi:MFS transporter [Demequina sp. TTPB684]|uniref:MFS transporter n=1 Tax=unclassified Demequina TaxID=2620311 RepID=UPI001CF4F8C6|nr:MULTISPECIES: MFS transporter [unclassified Demequina]MCB2412281.1 MFS transporter [Demequina sp. TTPB684]UPU88480.1 MFS transporter [Demequina sp. TMPB413]